MLQPSMVETSHGRIALLDTGASGMPVLMIHGNSSSGRIFHNQMTGALGERYRLIAADLPGHGLSSDAIDPERTYNMPGYADAMVEVLARLGIEQAAVFGWSLGGHIGLEIVSRFPGLLGLMITGTPPVAAEEITQGFRHSSNRNLSGTEVFTDEDVAAYALATVGARQEPFIAEGIRRTDGRARKMNRAKFVAGFGGNQREIVATCPCPIAVVNGRDEPFVDADFIVRVKFAHLWEGRCHFIEGSGHAPFWDAPAAFNAIFGRFLNDISVKWSNS